MKSIFILFLGMFSVSAFHFDASAHPCPPIQDILNTMKCTYQGTNLYNCSLHNLHWTGEFQSQVDITQGGNNLLIGRIPYGDGCSYRYESQTVQVDYQIMPKKGTFK